MSITITATAARGWAAREACRDALRSAALCRNDSAAWCHFMKAARHWRLQLMHLRRAC